MKLFVYIIGSMILSVVVGFGAYIVCRSITDNEMYSWYFDGYVSGLCMCGLMWLNCKNKKQ